MPFTQMTSAGCDSYTTTILDYTADGQVATGYDWAFQPKLIHYAFGRIFVIFNKRFGGIGPGPVDGFSDWIARINPLTGQAEAWAQIRAVNSYFQFNQTGDPRTQMRDYAGSLWVCTGGNIAQYDGLIRIDPNTLNYTLIPIPSDNSAFGSKPTNVAFWGNEAWVDIQGTDKSGIAIIDITTNTVNQTIWSDGIQSTVGASGYLPGFGWFQAVGPLAEANGYIFQSLRLWGPVFGPTLATHQGGWVRAWRASTRTITTINSSGAEPAASPGNDVREMLTVPAGPVVAFPTVIAFGNNPLAYTGVAFDSSSAVEPTVDFYVGGPAGTQATVLMDRPVVVTQNFIPPSGSRFAVGFITTIPINNGYMNTLATRLYSRVGNAIGVKPDQPLPPAGYTPTWTYSFPPPLDSVSPATQFGVCSATFDSFFGTIWISHNTVGACNPDYSSIPAANMLLSTARWNYRPNPYATVATANPSSGIAPLTVTFGVTGDDIDSTSIGFLFDFGDGSPTLSVGPLPPGSSTLVSHTYTAAGSYAPTVRVVDDLLCGSGDYVYFGFIDVTGGELVGGWSAGVLEF